MAYSLSFSLALGAGNTGLTLEAQLKNSAGANVGSAITTGFVEYGASGNYQWYTTAIPDGHVGGVVFQVSPGGAVKAFAAISPQECENPDVKTSTRSSHTAADVWASGTRTLTSFGTLVADVTTAVWGAVTRTLTSGAAPTAAAIWAYSPRTLTQTAAQIAAVLAGSTITVQRGDTVTIALTDLGNITARTKLYFSVKDRLARADTTAILQVEETAGLLILNGAAGTAIDASLVVNNATTGNITITLKPATSAALLGRQNDHYDVQMVAGTVVTTLTEGTFTVNDDVTRAIA